MQRNECKPGTEVIIRGTISEDDGTDFNSIKITIRRDDGKTEDGFFEPSVLERAQPKYDPARKYRKGIWCESPDFTGGFSEVEVIGSCPQITQLEAKWPFVETRLREGMLASLMAFY